MTLKSVPAQTDRGGAIRELQGLKTAVVSGAAADTDITVATSDGIALKSDDTLESVIMFAAGVPSDVTVEASIQSNGKLQLDTTNSTGNKLMVTWWRKPSGLEV